MQDTSPSTSPGNSRPPRQAAIVGINAETAALLPALLESPGIQVIRILNPDNEDLGKLTLHPQLEVIIDTTRNPAVAARLRKLPLRRVDIVSGVGARILFRAVRGAHPDADRDHVLRCLEEVRGASLPGRGLDEILRTILGTAMKVCGADSGSVMLLDSARRKLTIEAAIGLDGQIVLTTAQPADHGVSGTALRTLEPVILQGEADKAAHGANYSRPDLMSSVCCPMLLGEEAVGVLNIASRTRSRAFGSDDAALLSDLGRLAAEAVAAAREGEVPAHGAHSPALILSLQEIFSMRFRFEERMDLLLMKVANAFGAQLAAWYEYCPEDGVFVAKASSAATAAALREKPRFLDDFFAQRALKTANTFCVNAAGKTPRGKKWFMIQPVCSGDNTVGALFVQLHSEKNNLKEESLLLRKAGELLGREIARNRRMEAIKADAVKFAAITQFGADLAAAGSLPDLNRMILANAARILEAETCVLRLRNSVDEDLAIHDTLSGKNPAWLRDILALDEMILTDARGLRAPLLYPDLRESPYNVDLLG
ncbi:MAG TPA: GAF domain-containing protein, partial [Fibrobacteria bacterium]|nr:GAF domain-containing protein [Fibrobacteria bacterium]